MSVSRERRVLTYGTYDLFHYGHMQLLQRARALGSFMVVGVSTDEFNSEKGKRAAFDYEKRAGMVATLRCVDRVIPEESWEQKGLDVVRYGIDTLVMGSDWEGHFDDLRSLCNVVYLERTPNVSSTALRSLHGIA